MAEHLVVEGVGDDLVPAGHHDQVMRFKSGPGGVSDQGQALVGGGQGLVGDVVDPVAAIGEFGGAGVHGSQPCTTWSMVVIVANRPASAARVRCVTWSADSTPVPSAKGRGWVAQASATSSTS